MDSTLRTHKCVKQYYSSEARNRQWHNSGQGLHSPLSTTDRSSRQKINIEMLDLNCLLAPMDLTVILTTFNPAAPDTHSSQLHVEQSPR